MRAGGRTPVIGADGTTRAGLRRVYVAEAVSGLGDGIFWIALLGALAEQEQFEVLVAVAVVARLGPRALAGARIGAIIARLGSRPAVIGAEVLRAVIMLWLAHDVADGVAPPVLLAGVLVAYVLAAPVRPALAGLLPRVAGEAHLARAAATVSVLRQQTSFLGPVLGVAVVAASVPLGFVVNAVTFLVAAALYVSIPARLWPPRRSVQARMSDADEPDPSTDAPWLRGVAGVVALTAAVYAVRGAELVLYVLVVTSLLGREVASVGLVTGAVGLGALLGAPLAARLTDRRPAAAILWVGVVLVAVPTAMLAVVTSIWSAVGAAVLVGGGVVAFEVASVITIQRTTPTERLESVFGFVAGASNGGRLVGAVLVPAVVAAIGVATSMVAVAAVLLVTAIGTAPWVVRASRLAEEQREQLAPTVDVLERIPVLTGVPPRSLERVAARTVEEERPRGDVIVREHEPADDLYLVRSGDLAVTVDNQRVATLGAGGWFGEIGLLEAGPRTATVMARTPVTLWRIPGDVFLEALEQAGAAPSALLDGARYRSNRARADE